MSVAEQVDRKKKWLKDLSEFKVEADLKTWAADAGELPPEDGFKRHQYIRNEWRLLDSYTGFFRAPGFTTVYYMEVPAWTMAYHGEGMRKGHEDLADETFAFLRKALMRVTPDLPFRGPGYFLDGGWIYIFQLRAGNIEDFRGKEDIYSTNDRVFTQEMIGGLVLPKDANRKIVYPWDRLL